MVNEKYKSHMFFWFFTRTREWTTGPLVVFLQGGLGVTFMFSLFTENGPYILRDNEIGYSEYSWTDHFNVLYIESPVGTGFSFTEFEGGYSNNLAQVGKDLHETLRKFLILFPQLQKNQLILASHSFGGQYVTSLANTISRKKLTANPKINVFGVIVGNPLISVEDMLPHYSDYLNAFGLLTAKGRRTMQEREEEILSLILGKKCSEASDLFSRSFFLATGQTFLRDLTGIRNHFHILKGEFGLIRPELFLNDSDKRKTLHVGNSTFDVSGSNASVAMKSNFAKSYKIEFEEMLRDTRVLVFSGQFDISCAYFLNEKLFNHLSWSGAAAYRESNTYPFTWGGSLGGHFKLGGNLIHVLVRNAGHLPMKDQRHLILGLLKKFAEDVFDGDMQSLGVTF